MFIGTAGQGQFSDRCGRKIIYQFNLLLFGIFTILGAFAPTVTWLIVCALHRRHRLGAEQPLAFAYAGEYSPKAIRGRILAIVHFIGGACVWPIASLFTLFFRDSDRLARRLDRHRHRRADRLGVPLHACRNRRAIWRRTAEARKRSTCSAASASPDRPSRSTTDAASNTKSDPFGVVFTMFPRRVIAGMICFSAFFGVAIGLGTWLPNIMTAKGFTITKSLHLHLRHDTWRCRARACS